MAISHISAHHLGLGHHLSLLLTTTTAAGNTSGRITNASIFGIGMVPAPPHGGSWVWEAHIYGFAIAWFLMGLFALVTGINLQSFAPAKPLLNRICTILCIQSVLRAIYLMTDPYETRERVPVYVSRVLYCLCTPAFLATFLYMFLALLSLARLSEKPRICQSKTIITCAMVAFYFLILFSEVISVFYHALAVYISGTAIFMFAIFSMLCYLTYLRYGLLMLQSFSVGVRGGARGYKSAKGLLHPCEDVPKIKITDENSCTLSYKSETSFANSDTDDFDHHSQQYQQPPQSLIRYSASLEHTANIGEDGNYHSNNNSPSSEHSPEGLNGDVENGGHNSYPNTPGNNSSHQNDNGTEKAKTPFESGIAEQLYFKQSMKAGGKPTRRANKHRSTRSRKPPRTRIEKLKVIIRLAYLPALLGFSLCAWQIYEVLNRHWLNANQNKSSMELQGTWPNFIGMTAYRFTELMISATIGYLVKYGFNKL